MKGQEGKFSLQVTKEAVDAFCLKYTLGAWL
jgi:hypothetical protein